MRVTIFLAVSLFLYLFSFVGTPANEYVIVGDSVFSSFDARIVSAHEDAQHRPNAATTNNIISQFYDKLPGQKATYHRLDASEIALTGKWNVKNPAVFGMDTFAMVGNVGSSFVFTATKSTVRLIYWRTGTEGTLEVTSACVQSAGDVGGTIPPQCTDYHALSTQSDLSIEYTEYNLAVIPGERVTVNVSTGSAFVWGVIELEENDITVTNLSRGGHNFDELYFYADADINSRLNRGKTFIVQVPLMNMINDKWTALHIMESSLRYFNALAGEDVIVVIPNYRAKYMVGDVPEQAVADAYNTVKVIAQNYNYKIVDMRDFVSDFAHEKGITIEQALTGSGVHGDTLTADGSHPNDLGSDYFSTRLLEAIQESYFFPVISNG